MTNDLLYSIGKYSQYFVCFPGGSVVKNLPANAGDTGDVDSIPGSGRSPRGGNGYPPQYSSWKIPRTKEPGGLRYMRSQRVGRN